MIPVQQSPINLADPYPTSLGKRRLKIHWRRKRKGDTAFRCRLSGGVIKESEHGLQVSFPFNRRNRITLDQREFILSEFHFHFPTEHFVNGAPVKDAMELHIVHRNPDDATIAVLGVFILPANHGKSSRRVRSAEKGERLQNLLEQCLPALQQRQRLLRGGVACAASENEGDAAAKNGDEKSDKNPTDEPVSTDACDWIPQGEKLGRYFRYEGSLTTPDYNETVSWVVFPEPVRVDSSKYDWPDTKKDWDKLKETMGHSARPIQSLNRRFILMHDDKWPEP